MTKPQPPDESTYRAEISSSIAQVGSNNTQHIHLPARQGSGPKKTAIIVGTAAILLILTVAAIIWPNSGTKRTSDTGQARVTRPLASWVAEVSSTCAPVPAKVQAVRPKGNPSTQEEVAGLKLAADIYKTLTRDLNRLELPSSADDRAKAGDWVNAYNDWYQSFLVLIQKLDDATSGGMFGEWLSLPGVKSANSEFQASRLTMKSKGDALGIVCPGMTL